MTSYFSGQLWGTAGRRINRTAVGAGSYTVLDTDHIVAKTAITGGGDTITLPPAATVGDGTTFVVVDESGNAGADNLTITGAGAETINGATEYTVDEPYEATTFYCDGANWFTLTANLSARVELGDLLVVDIVAGDDDNIGNVDTAGNRLRTLKEAFDRFFPAHLPMRHLASDVVKEILVKYTPGMPALTENLVKPLFVGPGQALITFEQEVVHSVTQSGAVSAVLAGSKALRRVTFTTSPFTASTLGAGHFLTPVDDRVQAGSNNAAFIHAEHTAIVDNAVDSVDVPFVAPGSIDGFSFVNTSAEQIVRNQITWRPEAVVTAGGGFGPYPAMIANPGGMLVVKGAIFDPPTDAANQSLVNDLGRVKGIGTLDPRSTVFTMCEIKPSLIRAIEGSESVEFSGCFMDAGAGASSLRFLRVADLAFGRCHLTSQNGSYNIDSCKDLWFDGNYVTRTAGTTNHFNLINVESPLVWRSDFREDVNLVALRCQFVNIADLSFEDMGNDCMAFDECGGIVGNCIGTSGNNGYGVRLRNNTKMSVRSTNTVAGISGELIVGNIPSTFAAGDVLDLATSVRETANQTIAGPAAVEVYAITVADEAARAALTGAIYLGRLCFQQDTEEVWIYDGTSWHLTVSRSDAVNAILINKIFS